ncbi:MAG: hypothetical protein ABIL58_24245 [Pseudomonadota bacterium]
MVVPITGNRFEAAARLLARRMGYDFLAFFTMLRDEYFVKDFARAVLAVDIGGGKRIPHPVHLREGMQVRNFLRDTELFPKWDAHDYDNRWSSIVMLALDLCSGCSMESAA